MHKGEHAHRKEANGVKGEERSDNVLAGVDVFEQTENAVNADEHFNKRHPREFLGVVAFDFLFGSTALRGTDEAALGAENGGEYGAGVADGDAYAKSHQDR